jgi:hypothetical protein
MTNAEREQALSQAESMMLRGIVSAAAIARSLKISPHTAGKYVKIIRQRWASKRDRGDLAAMHAELVEQARETLRRAWSVVATAANEKGGNASAQVGALRIALQAQERLAQLLGLDEPRVAGDLSFDTAAGALDAIGAAVKADPTARVVISAAIAATRVIEARDFEMQLNELATAIGLDAER